MKLFISRLMASFVLAILVFATAAFAFEKAQGKLITSEGKEIAVSLELALTPEQQTRGLMFRQTLAADAGMLFDYGAPREVVMWMANTPLSLDMFFIKEDGTIARIEAHTEPFSKTRIPSLQPVRYVLETNAGFAVKHGLKAGDRFELTQ